ncbi:hypothetical protein DesyoDRAFT_5432 [Desulfosporosinus youngiae DSM 17734]|uniref:DUF951 domain-containing protein n=2 Tax=Desulfosporosinus TaxID=79206 RepID=H5Y0U5_9FIRM|nr:hypothetical protein DesyoDRAFT_5432 [Desulfosporosinus youngiae DSM 17734]
MTEARGVTSNFEPRFRGELIKMVPLNVGDIVRLRKPHPCGSVDWKVMRTGMDFRIQCLGCQHQAWIPRVKLERNLKEILQHADEK